MTQELRAWPRASMRLRVWVLTEGSKPVAYTARNLSAGGALLTEGPPLTLGREIKIMLPLRGRDLVLHARVARSESDAQGRPCAAACFRGVPTFVQDLIQNHVLRLLSRSEVEDQGRMPLR